MTTDVISIFLCIHGSVEDDVITADIVSRNV